MPPTRSTRSRLKSNSQSQSQSQQISQSLSLPQSSQVFQPSASEDVSHDSQLNSLSKSLGTVSTASLPPNHTVFIGLPDGDSLNEEEQQREYVRGEELLADGWLKSTDKVGKLKDLRARIKHRQPLVNPAQKSEEVLWYAAGLSYPCTCELRPLKTAWTPRYPPLTKVPIDVDQDTQVPLVGSLIPEWNGKPFQDLDHQLDLLEEFESRWSNAKGQGWRLFDTAKPHGASQESVVTAVESPDSRRLRKGKFKAPQDCVDAQVFSPVQEEAESESPLFPLVPKTTIVHSRMPDGSKDDTLGHLQDLNRRKAWWRSEIRSSGSYGRIWSILPRPHSLEAPNLPRKRRRKTKVPEYILPKYFTSTEQHPFHPNLHDWIKRNPRERVYWLIPIHGPVHVPSYSDHLATPPPSAPLPSPATLTDEANLESKPKTTDLRWTTTVLKHFWTSFLVPLHSNPEAPFGTLSIRLSGPKPDPFIDLPPPSFAKQSSERRWNGQSVEAGDHIRVYVDAKYALRLRTWLRGVEIDLKHLEDGEQENKQEVYIRSFRHARLILANLAGECLMLA